MANRLMTHTETGCYAKIDDLAFIYGLMQENYKTLGLIPPDAVRRACRDSRAFVRAENGNKIGYLLLGPVKKGHAATIWQLCIEKDKRRRGYGRELFKQACDFAAAAGASGLKLRCADDARARLFWESLGFKKSATGPATTQCDNLYMLLLERPSPSSTAA